MVPIFVVIIVVIILWIILLMNAYFKTTTPESFANDCPKRPDGWCSHQGAVYSSLQCNIGDNNTWAHVCTDSAGHNGLIKVQNNPTCQGSWPESDFENTCPNAVQARFACPLAPAGWCSHQGAKLYADFDCGPKRNGITLEGTKSQVCVDNDGHTGLLAPADRCQQRWPDSDFANTCPRAIGLKGDPADPRLKAAADAAAAPKPIPNAPKPIPNAPKPIPASPKPIDSILENNASLNVNERIVSPNGKYKFILQRDGNAVVYGPNGATWATGTSNQPSAKIMMQSDGNLVIYNSQNNALWACCLGRADGAKTLLKGKHPNHNYSKPFRLVMQDDGNLVIYDRQNIAFWAIYI